MSAGRIAKPAAALLLSSALFAGSALGHEHHEDAIPDGMATSEDPIVCETIAA
jgi:hypothetical protein